jgi:hypothetical protein
LIQTGVLDAIDDAAQLSLLGGGASNVADAGFAFLEAGIEERVGSLLLGGVGQTKGITYGSTTSTALFQSDEYFGGAGVISVGLPGDFNDDGSVDAADYVTWRTSSNPVIASVAGYNLWRSNFGNSAAGAGTASGGAAVPEPSACVLAIAILGWIYSLRRVGRR